MNQLHETVYTPYQECEQFKNWVAISARESVRARRKLKNYLDNIISCSVFGAAEYLINGCVVKTQESSVPGVVTGWNFKIYSESKRGLERIAKTLGLPFKK